MAKFEVGHPKFGGRKAGTPNRRNSSAKEILDSLGVDPIREMALLVNNESLDISQRITLLKELALYSYSKIRPIDDEEDRDELRAKTAKMSNEELSDALLEAAVEETLHASGNCKEEIFQNLVGKIKLLIENNNQED